MVTPEDIEKLEAQLQRNREILARGGSVEPVVFISGPPKLQPTIIELTKVIKDRVVSLAVIPIELITYRPPLLASALRIEQTRVDCDTQRMVVEFTDPVRVEENGIFMKAPLGKGRLRFQEDWIRFDPWLAFDGSATARKTRKTLKALGVIFRSQDK